MKPPWKSSSILALLLGCIADGSAAQELALKRDVPLTETDACEVRGITFAPVSSPGSALAAEADRLVAEATEASILGTYDRARALLTEAVTLDPTSPSASYRYGRLLETVGESEAALSEYCRFLGLEPDVDEVADVESRVDRIGVQLGILAPRSAREAFEAGLDAFDDDDPNEAVEHFSRALAEQPEWEEAYFNRAVAYQATGRNTVAAADLEWYLEYAPDADDRAMVEERIQALGPGAARTYSPRTALVSGLLLPGMGHFYSDRPGLGALVLGSVGASVGVGLFYREVTVDCLVPPVDGRCPEEHVLERSEERPLLTPALAAAGAITVLAAIHAYRSAGAPVLERSVEIGGVTATPTFSVAPALGPRGGGLLAELRVRF